MEISDIAKVEFDGKADECNNYILIGGPDDNYFLRFVNRDAIGNHGEQYTKFLEELKKNGIAEEGVECKGGGYCSVYTKENEKYPRYGEKTYVSICTAASSLIFGEPNLEIVERLLVEDGRFDEVSLD